MIKRRSYILGRDPDHTRKSQIFSSAIFNECLVETTRYECSAALVESCTLGVLSRFDFKCLFLKLPIQFKPNALNLLNKHNALYAIFQIRNNSWKNTCQHIGEVD